jgi:pimeloyl-ACP methyl ester carboxylesterase
MNPLDLPLHVETHGLDPEPDVDVVLLLHGYGGSTYTWRYWVPHLAKRAHVVLVDMKGFGLAPKPDDGRYTAEDQAELIYRLILQRGFTNLTLVGHSFGGAVSLLVALRLNDEGARRLLRLVLVSSAAYPQSLPPFVKLARYSRLCRIALRLIGATRLVRFVLRSIVYNPEVVHESQVLAYADPLATPEGRRAYLDAALQIVPKNPEALTSRFREIACPTLLIWGKHDRVVPLWVGERLKAEMPDARLHVFDHCGHIPPEELPEDTWARLEAFL